MSTAEVTATKMKVSVDRTVAEFCGWKKVDVSEQLLLLTLLQRCTGLLTAQTALKHLSRSQFSGSVSCSETLQHAAGEAGNRTSDLPVSGRPALPPELQSNIINIEVTPTLDKAGIFSKAFCYRVDLNLPSWIFKIVCIRTRYESDYRRFGSLWALR